MPLDQAAAETYDGCVNFVHHQMAFQEAHSCAISDSASIPCNVGNPLADEGDALKQTHKVAETGHTGD